MKYVRWRGGARCPSGGVRRAVQAVTSGPPARCQVDEGLAGEQRLGRAPRVLLRPCRWRGEDCLPPDTGVCWALGSANRSLREKKNDRMNGKKVQLPQPFSVPPVLLDRGLLPHLLEKR